MSVPACGHLDGFVCAKCANEGAKWFPKVTVERYSVDQTTFALARLAEEKSWKRRPLVARFGLDRLRGREIRVPVLHGDYLRQLFPGGPEDGYAYDVGNTLVTGGLNNITYLLTTGNTATAGAAAGHNNLGAGGASASTSICGVGSGTAYALADTHLAADNTAGCYYQQFDATFPTTTAGGIINGQSTYGTGVANFNWNEWCWATGSGAVTAGSQLSAVATATNMMNHKVPASSLGSKASGASWVFSSTITFS